jgi:hypothetical protein
MHKCSIVFDEQLFKQINSRAKKKKITKAAYIRHLILLGLAQEKQDSTPSLTSSPVSKWQKIMFTGVLETIYLSRNILSNNNATSSERQAQLTAARTKAMDVVERLLAEEKE